MTRPSIQQVATLAIILTVLTAPALPAAGSPAADKYDDTLTPAASEVDGLIGYNIPDDARTYGSSGDPGWLVYYTEGEYTSLESWLDHSDSRRLISHDEAANRVLIAAPPVDVLGGLSLGLPPERHTGLADRSYIRLIDLNRQHTYADPVDQLARTDEATLPLPRMGALIRGGEFTTEGVAYSEDANRTPLGDARDAISADGTGASGAGVSMCVADTGANVGDGELYGNGTQGSDLRIQGAKNIITNETVNTSAGSPDWSIIEDANGHGSWVLSAAAANVSNDSYDGVAPDATLYVAKVLNDDGEGSTEQIASGIAWCEAQGADIISLSLGSPLYSETIAASIRDALAGNTTVVTVAAGNSRQNPATRYISSPADVPETGVIGVAASNTTAPANASVAYFSEVGEDNGLDGSNTQTAGMGPDITAPGMRVVAPVLSTNGARANSSLSGTSMATPLVAGAAAQLLAADGTLVNDTAATEERLLETASPMPQAGVTEAGHGMVNASNAVTDTRPSDDQRDVRTDAAERRDVANEELSGSRALRFIADAGSTVSGVVA